MARSQPVDPTNLDLASVAERLASSAGDHTAAHPDHPWQAAVAVVLAPGEEGLELAFIERAERTGDRWSGHMAFPGGRREPEDADLARTAARETAEEVGLVLPEPIGRLADQHGRSTRGLVAAFVYALDEPRTLTARPEEVAAADWISLRWLLDPANTTRKRWFAIPFPGIEHRGRVIWGLTHRILGDLAARVGLEPPGR